MDRKDNLSFGVFKPVGYVVVSFPTAQDALNASDALQAEGFAESDLNYLTDRDMLQQIEQDLASASPIAAIGQELNLIRAHQALAERGYHWLIVHAPKDEQARRVATIVEPLGAERAQQYGHFIIEELIENHAGFPQVAESPERGLDAQTPTGLEAERADMKHPLR